MGKKDKEVKRPRTLDSPIQFMGHHIKEAIFHPRRKIKYIYCTECKMRLHPNEKECPKGLDEAARALVYIPLGSLFGMSLKRD